MKTKHLLLFLSLAVTAIHTSRVMAAPTLEVLYSWQLGPSKPVSELIQASDGNFLGTTTNGGAHGVGTVFKMTPAGVMTVLVHFTRDGAINMGAHPQAALVRGSDGNFYGTTREGGGVYDSFGYGYGTVFKMTPAGVLTTLVEFTDNGATNKGKNPEAGLTPGTDGNFYGTTSQGGANGKGTVFKMTPGGVLTTLLHFTGNGVANKGESPFAELARGSDGDFYGTTAGGGVSGSGTVFKMTPAGVLTTLVEFTDNGATNKGRNPEGALVEDSDGNFYGTTVAGGAGGNGTVFKMTPAGVVTTLVEFDLGTSATSGGPAGALVKGSDGNFYGTTVGGGSDGTVFKMTPAGAVTTLVQFDTYGPDANGSNPSAALVQGSDGNFYGTTATGGGFGLGLLVGGFGTVFKMTPDGTLTTLVEFTGNQQGESPQVGVVAGSDGNLYGSTALGGTNNSGTVFKLTSFGAFTKLVDFNYIYPPYGIYPRARLVEGRDGNFYGTTYGASTFSIYIGGGTGTGGSVFKMTPAGLLTQLVQFYHDARRCVHEISGVHWKRRHEQGRESIRRPHQRH